MTGSKRLISIACNFPHFDFVAIFSMILFQGCELDPRTHEVAVPAMVRPGSTTNFKTESVEDLENQIVHTFTEKGDWVLDLFCGDRELSLAAQKSGRNAIAVHNRFVK